VSKVCSELLVPRLEEFHLALRAPERVHNAVAASPIGPIGFAGFKRSLSLRRHHGFIEGEH
jgi:hypothetical protein